MKVKCKWPGCAQEWESEEDTYAMALLGMQLAGNIVVVLNDEGHYHPLCMFHAGTYWQTRKSNEENYG